MSNVLVIDDDMTVLETLRKGLGSMGHTLLIAQYARDGWKKAFWRKVDVILLDIDMPGTNGLNLLKKLKGTFRTSHIPVIMFTGHDEESFKKQAISDYCEYYILKGTGIKDISEKINKVVQNTSIRPSGWPTLFRW